MSKNQIVFITGLLLVAIPLSGFPYTWKMIAYMTLGLLLILMAAVSYLKIRHTAGNREKSSSPIYVENSHIAIESSFEDRENRIA
jgi:hypothetical protein